jgi:hypothetical protein
MFLGYCFCWWDGPDSETLVDSSNRKPGGGNKNHKVSQGNPMKGVLGQKSGLRAMLDVFSSYSSKDSTYTNRAVENMKQLGTNIVVSWLKTNKTHPTINH